MNLFPGVAVVFGAASGVGQQVAISFAVRGCNSIALLDCNENNLANTNAEIRRVSPGAKTLACRVDVRIEESVVEAIAAVVQEFGRIDYAVNAAGIMGGVGPLGSIEACELDNMFNTNVRGVMFCCREEARRMAAQTPLPTHDGREGSRGSIINIGSMLGYVGHENLSAYSATKQAIVGLTRGEAIDHARDGIRVNCVCPGPLDTPMAAGFSEHCCDLKSLPIRKGTTQEVADVVLFLASAQASFVQGASWLVDGRYTIF